MEDKNPARAGSQTDESVTYACPAPYTEEQLRHLLLLEDRCRELEQQLLTQVANISRHLQAALDNGMEEYRTFNVDGHIYIEYIDNPAVPESVNEKFANLYPHTVSFACDGHVEDCLRSTKEVTDNFDWRYIQHPEDYPEDYKPDCRAFSQFITSGMAYGHFTIDELMLVKPEDICAHVRIDI